MHINTKELGIEVSEKGIFIIVLGSKWCRSCKILSQIFTKFTDEGIVTFKEIEIGEDSKLAMKLGISSVPALIFFKDGKLLEKTISMYGEMVINEGVLVGTFNETILREIINKILDFQ